jgi:hypothetical protein
MPINNPNSEDLDRIAKDLGLQLSATEISSYEEILDPKKVKTRTMPGR